MYITTYCATACVYLQHMLYCLPHRLDIALILDPSHIKHVYAVHVRMSAFKVLQAHARATSLTLHTHQATSLAIRQMMVP